MQNTATPRKRLTVALPNDVLGDLKKIARKEGVSLSEIIRRATLTLCTQK
jgi:hypothetical protein